MKKNLNNILFMIFFFIMVFFNIKTGLCSEDWSDIKDHYHDILENFRCTYVNEEQDILPFKEFKFYYYKEQDSIYDAYDKYGDDMFKGHTLGYHYLDGYRIFTSNFLFRPVFENYKEKGKCPTFVYFCDSVGGENKGIDYDLLNNAYDDTFNHTCVKYTSTTATSEDLTPNGCHYEDAKSCKNYSKTINNKTLYVELGKTNANKNYVLMSYDANFTPSAVIEVGSNGGSGATLINGDSTYILKDDSKKTYFDYVTCNGDSCTYPDDIQIAYSCTGGSGYNYVYFIFDVSSTYDNVDFGVPLSHGDCEKGEIVDPEPVPPYQNKLNYESLCSNDTDGNRGIRSAFRVLGYLLTITKWLVPIILIIFGIIDFTKAVISSDEKAINKATMSLIKRFVAGLLVLLIPVIIMALLNFIEVTNGIENSENFAACTKCIFDPFNSCPK